MNSFADLYELFLGLRKFALVLEEHSELVVDLVRLLVGRQPRQFEREVELTVVAGVVNALTFLDWIRFINKGFQP